MQAEITVPGVGEHRPLYAKVVLDSGADVSCIPESLCRFLKTKFPGIPICSTLIKGNLFVRLARGQSVTVKQKLVPLRLKLHTAWGTVEVKPQVSAVMPGDDCTF